MKNILRQCQNKKNIFLFFYFLGKKKHLLYIETMQLRTRIFLLVVLVFVIPATLLLIGRDIYFHKAVDRVQASLEKEIERLDTIRRDNLIRYLDASTRDVEEKLSEFLQEVDSRTWLKERFIPSDFNLETKNWGSSAILLMSNQWIDFAQVVTDGELTAQISLKPPYLDEMYRIVVDEDISIIVRKNALGEIEAFVGVPFWENDILQKYQGDKDFNVGDLDRDNWLLYTVDQLDNLKKSDLLLNKKISLPKAPFAPIIQIASRKLFEYLVQSTIDMTFYTKDKLDQHPDLKRILRSKQKTRNWIEKRIPLKDIKKEKKVFCFKDRCPKELSELENYYSLDMGLPNGRFALNKLVWEYATLMASGTWEYSPFYAFAPKGVASYYAVGNAKNIAYPGVGFMVQETFGQKPIPVTKPCSLQGIQKIPARKIKEWEGPQSHLYKTCIEKKSDIYIDKESYEVFLLKTMQFIREPDKGGSHHESLFTIGVRINPILEQLAMISPNKFLFLTKSGEILYYDSQGKVEVLPPTHELDPINLVHEKTGAVKTLEGKEAIFFHIASIADDSGYVFVIEVQDSALDLVKRLDASAEKFLHRVTLSGIIIFIITACGILTLILLVLRPVIMPLRTLARAAKDVGEKKYNNLDVSEKTQNRSDEIGTLCRAFSQMIEAMKQGEKVRGILNKVVSKEIADKIIKDQIPLGGEIREATVLFSDIRNFTSISEKKEPPEVLEMLNDCLTVLSRVIDEHEGIIDKYIGDEIMALFGAPIAREDSAVQAIYCAISMMDVLKEWNRIRSARNLETLQIGIGIHTGQMIAGNIGAENHLSYTVLGHNVNLASRLSGYAKEMEILITDQTLHSKDVENRFQTESLGPITLRGVSEPVTLHRVLGKK